MFLRATFVAAAIVAAAIGSASPASAEPGGRDTAFLRRPASRTRRRHRRYHRVPRPNVGTEPTRSEHPYSGDTRHGHGGVSRHLKWPGAASKGLYPSATGPGGAGFASVVSKIDQSCGGGYLMLCTIIWDVYADAERRDMWQAIHKLMPADSPDWSRRGVYAFWDPNTRELLYVGLATDLPERFAQHNRLIPHRGETRQRELTSGSPRHERLGFTLLIQGAAVQLLESLRNINPMLGVETREIARIAEGQLIELHKLEHGRRPRWNGVGGFIRGAELARPSDRSIIRLLSAADASLLLRVAGSERWFKATMISGEKPSFMLLGCMRSWSCMRWTLILI